MDLKSLDTTKLGLLTLTQYRAVASVDGNLTRIRWGRASKGLGIQHPRRDVTLAVQHAPDINAI